MPITTSLMRWARNQPQDQCHLPAVAAQEIGKRLRPAPRRSTRARFGRGGSAAAGLAQTQHRHHAHHIDRPSPDTPFARRRSGRRRPGARAASPRFRRIHSTPGAGPDHAPGGNLSGTTPPALPGVGVGRFNAECVQRDVLRGRSKGHRQGAPDDGAQGQGQVGHAHQPGHHHGSCASSSQLRRRPSSA